MVREKGIGQKESELLRFVIDQNPITVRQVADSYGIENGLARTTILTTFERLREKGFLKRRKIKGTFAYEPARPTGEIMKGVVSDFITKTLGGRLNPIVAYLTESSDLNNEEIKALRLLATALADSHGNA